jgi:hypothetical protein
MTVVHPIRPYKTQAVETEYYTVIPIAYVASNDALRRLEVFQGTTTVTVSETCIECVVSLG